MHRDIKLENILLEEENDWKLKISDFGLSEFITSNSTRHCGSPGYCAPEIFENNIQNAKVDIFSTGVLMYILLTSNHLFKSQTNDQFEVI